MNRALGALAVCVALARCSCDPLLQDDAGVFACTDDGDCARGFHCAAGSCLPEGFDAGAPVDAGRPDAGEPFDAGRPLSAALRFSTPPRTMVAGRCSPLFELALFDDAGQKVAAPENLPITLISAADLSLFSDSDCNTAVTGLTFPSGATAAPLRARGRVDGRYDLIAASAVAGSDTQSVTVVPDGPGAITLTSAPQPARLAGTCVGPITFSLRDAAGNPALAPDGGQTIDLLAVPPGLRLHAQSDCGDGPRISLTVPAGQSGGSLWAESPSGRTYTLTLDANGYTPDNQMLTVLPLVHAGRCDLGNGEQTKTCAIAPAQTDAQRTFLVYQASTTEQATQRAAVTCVLQSVNEVLCQRNTGTGNVSVAWQTVELADARVDRYETTCPASNSIRNVGLDASVPLPNYFVLAATHVSGTIVDDNDFFSVTPTGPTQVQLEWGSGCNAARIHLQVVQVPGFTSLNVTGALATGAVSDVKGALAASNDAFVLNSWRHEPPSAPRIGDRMLRAYTSGNDEVTVSRGAGNASDQIKEANLAWSLARVSTGSRGRSQLVQVDVAAGATSAQRNIASVDVTRSFVFISGQSGGAGQAAGESAWDADGGQNLGEATALVRLTSSTQLQLDRSTSNSNASFAVYVVELNP